MGIALVIAGLAGAVWLGLHIAERSRRLPALPTRPAATLPEASVILAADGSQLGTLFDERRIWKPLDSMSPVVIDALLAGEDHRFATHSGVDWVRMAGAFWSTLTGDPEGASTIPMQLARNYFPELKQHDLLDRKIEEILLARRISAAMTKDETLEWYLNTVAFGHNSFGIEAAAQRFYSASSADLTLSQAALLVGLLKGPSRYDPLRNPDAARARRNTVIQRMADLDLITADEAQPAQRSALNLKPHVYDPADSFAPYFLDHVRREAEQWAQRAGYDLRNDGLVIHTSIRPELQRMAEQAVAQQTDQLQQILLTDFGAPGSVRNEQFWRRKRAVEEDLIRRTEPYRTLRQAGRTDHDALLAVRSDHAFVQQIRQEATRLQGALVAIDPGSGQILAWVGGHDYRTDQFDKVASARRQPGSVFKPILYARALEDGYSPFYLVSDEIRTFTTTAKGETWTPTNAGGGASGRLVTLEQGLAWSKNTVSAHLISKIGPQDVIDLARALGISSPMMPVPSLALGTSETSLLEMTSAYATLADMGIHRNVTSITSISDREGKLIATFPSEPDRVLSEQTSFTMIRMLQKAVDQGTGGLIRSRFGIQGDLAGKTGTTQNNADGWFIGMHPDAVVGAWVGFNDQRITFQSDYWGQGGHNALLLAGDFLKQAMRGPGAILPPGRFQRPDGYREPVRPVYSSPSPDVEVPDPATEPLMIRAPQRIPVPLPIPPNRP
jgi:penicillin-binding protein 1A